MNVYGVFMLYDGENALEGVFHNKYRVDRFMSSKKDFDEDRVLDVTRMYYITNVFIDKRGE